MERQHRLRASVDFERARRKGRTWSNRLVLLNAVFTQSTSRRCGFVVSKRVGTAVVRNRVKRRLREIIRPLLPRLPAGWDLVFVCRPAATGVSFSDLAAAVEEVLSRAHLLPRPVGAG